LAAKALTQFLREMVMGLPWRHAKAFLSVLLLGACSRAPLQDSSLRPFEANGLWGYRNTRGDEVISPRFFQARDFSTDGIAAVVDESGWVYIDRTAAPLVRPVVVDNGPDYFSEGLARCIQDGRIGFFDARGQVVIEPRLDFALPFSESRAGFCEGCREQREGEYTRRVGGKWGFIDRAGAVAVPARYDEVESFAQGKARVRIQSGWIFINRDGKLEP
jgi:hypothetical protein